MLGRGGVPSVPPIPRVALDGGAAAEPAWVGAGQVLGPCVIGFGADVDSDVAAWGKRLAADVFGGDPLFAFFAEKLCSDLVLVGDDIMTVLTRECTEFSARVQLHTAEVKKKTVAQGPFYSEYLPAETILAAPLTLRVREHGDALSALLTGTVLQLGGDETIGKGLMWTRLLGSAA